MSRYKLTFIPQQYGLKFSSPIYKITTGDSIVKEYVDVDPYAGEYEVTPSAEAQTLDTIGKRLTANVVINPIPSNYGLITWNGAFLTVS